MSKLPEQLSSHHGLCKRGLELARDQAGNQARQPRRPHSPCSFGRSSKKSRIFAEMFWCQQACRPDTLMLENPLLLLNWRHWACLPAHSEHSYHSHLLQGLPTHLSKTSWTTCPHTAPASPISTRPTETLHSRTGQPTPNTEPAQWHFLKIKEKLLPCFKKPFSCKSMLFNRKKLYYYQWNVSTVKLILPWARGTACDIPGNCTAPSYWPLKSMKVNSKTYWCSTWPAWASQQPGKIHFLNLHPEVLNPHHHHWTPLEKRWAAHADKREKSSCPPVELKKKNQRTCTQARTSSALMQTRKHTLPYMCMCTRMHIYTHISASDGTSAHNRPQEEGNMKRDTCSHCFLHKSSMATLTKSYYRGDDFSQDKLDVLDVYHLLPQSQDFTHARSQTNTALFNLLSSTPAQGQAAAINAHVLSCNNWEQSWVNASQREAKTLHATCMHKMQRLQK